MIKNPDGWNELDCGVRVRYEGGEPMEVAMPTGFYALDSKVLRKAEFELGHGLVTIQGAIYKRPGDDRLRAMVTREVL